MQKYNHQKIEKKWQAYWLKNKTFLAKDFSKKPKKYILVEFPYPSGEGLHMGHLRPYVAGDVYTRYQRLTGHETVFPIGWDAFGLPAENYAIKMGVQPSVSTKKNIANAKKQVNSWGISFDWSREINTTDPNYYKWTQWIFLQLFKKGLAYEATGLINWCPKDKTGLANEEVIDGKCERCGTTVEKKELRQWYLKITAYAEKLLEGLKHLPNWPEAVKLQQENWIGKKTGINITYNIEGNIEGRENKVTCFTTRPDTNFGATFVVLGPEHPLLKDQNILNLSEKVWQEIKIYQEKTANEAETERTDETRKKTGIFTGRYCINDLNGYRMPLYVADYVLGNVGTGAVVGVPGHDKRDFEFAQVFNIPVVRVVQKDSTDNAPIISLEQVQEEQGIMVNSGFLNGMDIHQATEKIMDYMEEKGYGKRVVNYKLRDWVFSRQRYWGEPIPLIHCESCANKKPKILVIHGLGGNSNENWFPWFKQQMESKGYEVLIPNLPNQQPPTLKVWVDALNKLKLSNSDRVFVVGHSLGGATACHFITQANLRVEKLILVAPTGKSQGEQNWKNLKGNGVEDPFINSIREFNKVGINWPRLLKLASTKVMYLSDNDPYVPLSVQDDYHSLKSAVRIFPGRGHFNKKAGMTTFPEILDEFPKVKSGWIPVPEKDLPVKLPPVKKYEPTGTGESPLAAVGKWVNVKCPVCNGPAKRETNTMPNWAGSSWYWLRYTDPKNKKFFADIKKQKYWTPVDVYFGGMEHTTLHLLYSRFWNLFLFDQGLATVSEPYVQRKPHGIILGPDGEKMSKSRGNVVNPNEIVAKYGADTLRMYELFLGPHDMTVSWNDQGIVGVRRFLDRVWSWASAQCSVHSALAKDSDKVQRALHRLIKKITEDLENFRFNTSVSAFMEFHNDIKDEVISSTSVKIFLTLLYPFAPHLCEELWQNIAPRLRSGSSSGKKSLQFEKWPAFDPALTIDQTIEIVIQVNGKVKGKLTVDRGLDQNQLQAKALELEAVKQAAAPGIKRTIFVPNKLINLVV